MTLAFRSFVALVVLAVASHCPIACAQVLTGQVELLNDVAIKHHWLGVDVSEVSPANWSWTLQQHVYDPTSPSALTGFPYAPIGTSFGFTLAGLTPADIGQTLRIDETNADVHGFDWGRFADWAWNSLPLAEADFGLVGGQVVGAETIESPAGPGQTRFPNYGFMGGTWPGSRYLLVDRLEFTLEDFSNHTTNQPFSLTPGTQLRMRVELYGVRTAPEPSTFVFAAWLLVSAVLFGGQRPYSR